MTKSQENMDNKATKIFKEFVELYCFYLKEQNEESDPTELKFTLFLSVSHHITRYATKSTEENSDHH